ncbi:alpha/beta fold hydrolase [Prosthecobacter sp.]|uniref:alpha/beta hydrolase n=1 Tax=Prosthecobacter sp. TaxID=1965333 RepID=UPI001DEC621E|nr:alpha/beta fold hydrolase [Prosthecobacter sp.]MCB1277485.1 alpha/beta fold hydrolase [Prosthecobacter sp.]
MPLWKRLLRLAAILILTPVIFLLGCQSKLIYHPSSYRAEDETMLGKARGERVRFTTSQGAQSAFYVPPRSDAAGLPQTVWLCFGGNASLALDWLRFTNDWDGRFAYLLLDYPGYGECSGNPTPATIRESSKAALEALAKHLNTTRADLQPRLALLGHSLGCAAALMAAEDLDVRRAVLLSPFTSMTDMGRIVLGWPLCHLNLHRFDNRKALSRVASHEGVRIVIFHGTDDEVIPARMGRALAEAHPREVTFYEVPGGHHNDLLSRVSDRVGDAMRELAHSGVR